MKYLKRFNESNKSDIDELLSYVDTDEFFKRTQIYIDRESGEAEVSFMYDDKNIIVSQRDLYKEKQTYAIFVDYKEIYFTKNPFYKNSDKLELLYNKIYELSHNPNYISYRRLIRTLREFLGVEFPEVEERVEEFSIFENNKIDFLSIKSLFEFYKKPYNENVLKELLKIKETGINTSNINESIRIDESIDTTSFEYTGIAEGIQNYLNKNGGNDLILTDLIEKCEEFEVVIQLGTSYKFNIDMISLESLCSFYNVKFNKDEIKKDISMNLGSGISTRNDIEFVNKRATEYLRIGRGVNARPIKSKVHFINENSFFEKGQLDSIYVLVDKIRNDNKSLDFIRSLHPTIGKNIWSGNKVINFIYDNKNFKIQTNTSQQYYTISINDVIIVDQVDSNKSYNISKSLYKLLLKYTRTKFYTWYSYFIRYLEVHLKMTRTEIYEKIEEFEILKYDKIDFISLESLFDYYNVKFSKDEMLKWFKDYADKVDLTKLVLNESVSNSEIYDEIISYLEEDSFLLTDKLKIVDQIQDKTSTQYKFKYNNQLYQVGDTPYFCVVNTTTKNKSIEITKETAVKLIDLLFESKSRREWINNVISHISPSNDLALIKDIKHRMIEFDVIKDGVIDLITLNQVFDYYGKGKRFDLKRLENALDVYEIKYIS